LLPKSLSLSYTTRCTAMLIKQGLPRTRSIMLDDLIASDNPVWVFDAFVDSLDLGALGFRQYGTTLMGRRPFRPLRC